MQQELASIGKYKVLGIVGTGSMGVVYRAFDPEIGRNVAIKMLKPSALVSLPNRAAVLERFSTEARSAGNLRHPNIVTVFEVDKVDDVPYIVMEYIEGEGLDAVIRRERKLSIAQTINYMSHVAQGLDYAHSRGVVHRDIKPSNLIVDKHDIVYIVDFGIAEFTDAELRPGEPVFGSPGYMSPEHIRNEPLDPRSDIFSLGVICFECLAGRRPFAGDNFSAVVSNILAGRRLSLHDNAVELPLSFDAVMERALATDKNDRFPSGHDLVLELRKAAGIGSIEDFAVVRTSVIDIPEEVNVAVDDEESDSETLAWRSLMIGFSVFAISVGLLFLLSYKQGSIYLFGDRDIDHTVSLEPLSLISIGSPELFQRLTTLNTLSSFEIKNLLLSTNSSSEEVVMALREVRNRKLEIASDAVAHYLYHPSSMIRVEAVDALSSIHTSESAPALINSLDDYDFKVRRQAAIAFQKIGDSVFLPQLVLARLKEPVGEVRAALQQSIDSLKQASLK